MDRARADESVATRFTRVMNASTSRWGVLSDVALAAVASGMILVVGFLAIPRGEAAQSRLWLVFAIAAVPVLTSAAASVALRGARERVVAWMTTVPFDVENMNALLAGVGDIIEVHFRRGAKIPPRPELMPKLESVSTDTFVLAEHADRFIVEIRLGVADSKRNPLTSNHRRYDRFVAVVEKVLVPLHGEAAIERVQVV